MSHLSTQVMIHLSRVVHLKGIEAELAGIGVGREQNINSILPKNNGQ